VFRNSTPPEPSEIGKALWSNRYYPNLENIYNVLSWYVLEEISHAWQRYLEENPAQAGKLSA
jgi:hypothetical protein